jgi:sulfhydrogenase subunit beta (sulfur reductase)
MDTYLLKKTDLPRWVELIQKSNDVFAPSRVQGEIFFSPISFPPDLDLLTGTATLPYLPPKDFVFPQAEELFSFSQQGEEVKLEVPKISTRGTVLLGIRSCDITGIGWMDKFYQDNFKDVYYTRRRENLTFISIACNQPVKNCFCVCCEGGPFLNPEHDEFDIQLVDLKENYLVESKSEKGKKLIALAPELFLKSAPSVKEIRDQLEEKSRQSFLTEPTSYMSFAIRRITENSVPPEVWTELGERCFDDGGCTFVCPCCSCFGVGYLSEGGKGCHYRFWDSCDYSGFTREVSGHNPRAEKGERFKRRFYHKLSYQYVKRDGRIGCVGCGRCITACPGEVGMPAVVERIRNSKAQRNYQSGKPEESLG